MSTLSLYVHIHTHVNTYTHVYSNYLHTHKRFVWRMGCEGQESLSLKGFAVVLAKVRSVKVFAVKRQSPFTECLFCRWSPSL